MRIEVDSEGYQPPRHGIFLLQALVLFLFCFFVLRFWYLQILRGENFEEQAHANRWKENAITANRGLILDSSGIILAENSPAYSVALVREDCPDIPAALAQVSLWTGLPLPEVESNYEQGRDKNRQSFAPLILAPNVDFEQVARIESQQAYWPGIVVISRQRRYYTHGSMFAHVLGYVSIASDDDHKKFPSLAIGDTVGKQGLEVMLEDRLRGRKGLNIAEVDVHGRQLLKSTKAKPSGGENVRLSLDLDLQEAATAAIGQNSGCIVVMEPDTGKLRALVTSPSYDNNIFTSKLSTAEWLSLRDDPRTPLHNRVIQSVYPPGSVWKLLMAGVLLESGVRPEDTVGCVGEVRLGNRTFRCWNKYGHGRMNMTRALVESCDVYFYTMGDRVGIDRISSYAFRSGFGKLTGIELPYEKPGLVPNREWKRANFKSDPGWQRGETYNTSIGQGFTLVTPVQMAVYTSSLLNGGKILKPLLVESAKPEVRGQIPATPAHREMILKAMRQTVEDPRGTAKRIARSDAVMGGKTGTAQVVRMGETRVKSDDLQYEHRDHAWMVGWGVKGQQKYVVVVMVEHGGGGSAAAGPVCRAVFDHLFSDRRKARPALAQGQVPMVYKQNPQDVNDILEKASAWLYHQETLADDAAKTKKIPALY
ncbi:penicillin-binding protein 2 [Desulfovibrio sp. OttesenSCG-928-C14]|nr:penicillin-binding protein 2 [Desulfovibrio sp. OttesenSCG-928-C14]